jgi:23S rRNA pseudouridine1911/1915/1917 synthase
MVPLGRKEDNIMPIPKIAKPLPAFKDRIPRTGKPPEAKKFTVDEPMGLLAFLILKLKGESRNNVKSLLARHQITVNGNATTQFDYELKKDFIVEVLPTSFKAQAPVSLPIIFENNELIVINKPSGLLSVADDRETEKTAFRMITAYLKANNVPGRLHVVHRIDKDTSGILLFSKSEELKTLLQDNWNDLVTSRGYYAIVEGHLDRQEGTIKSWLKETNTQLMYSSHKPGDGQEAITHYKVMNESDEYSLLDIHLETGRKNQIRVHMADIGHKVVGDDKYHSTKDPIHRLGLHAYALEFKHPVSGTIMRFKTPLPKLFGNLFDNSYKRREKTR